MAECKACSVHFNRRLILVTKFSFSLLTGLQSKISSLIVRRASYSFQREKRELMVSSKRSLATQPITHVRSTTTHRRFRRVLYSHAMKQHRLQSLRKNET